MAPAKKARAAKASDRKGSGKPAGKSPAKSKMPASTREWSRFSNLKEIYLVYEGQSEVTAVRAPDISPRGMFINTAASFPEGAVLKVRFLLARTNYHVQARGEVRYCLPGLGVGVEFIDIAPQDEKAIREEIRTSTNVSPRRK